MASRRLLKKRIKNLVYEVLDSCDYHMVNNTDSADKADAMIDEAVGFHEAMIARIGEAKTKSDFRSIAAELDKVNAEYTKQLNELG